MQQQQYAYERLNSSRVWRSGTHLELLHRQDMRPGDQSCTVLLVLIQLPAALPKDKLISAIKRG